MTQSHEATITDEMKSTRANDLRALGAVAWVPYRVEESAIAWSEAFGLCNRRPRKGDLVADGAANEIPRFLRVQEVESAQGSIRVAVDRKAAAKLI